MTKSYLDATRTELLTANLGILLSDPQKACFLPALLTATARRPLTHGFSQYTFATRCWSGTSYGAVFKATDITYPKGNRQPSPTKVTVSVQTQHWWKESLCIVEIYEEWPQLKTHYQWNVGSRTNSSRKALRTIAKSVKINCGESLYFPLLKIFWSFWAIRQ